MKIGNYISVCLLCLCASLSTTSATELIPQGEENIFPSRSHHQQREKVGPFKEGDDTPVKQKKPMSQKSKEENKVKSELVNDEIKELEKLKKSFKIKDPYFKMRSSQLDEQIGQLRKLLELVPQLSKEAVEKKIDAIDEKFNPIDDGRYGRLWRGL